MISKLAAISVLCSVVAAQSSSSSSPYIPDTGISESCKSFLVALDSNAQLATCSNSLLQATSLFSPNSAGDGSATASQITDTLRRLCSSSSQCSDDLIKRTLTQFSGNCSASDLSNTLVKSNYDVLYVLSPFTDAICTRDTASNKYCALEIGDESASAVNASVSTNTTSTTSTTQLTVQGYKVPQIELSDLYVHLRTAAKRAIKFAKRAMVGHAGRAAAHHGLVARQANGTVGSSANSTVNSNNNDALLPNATTFRSSNLPFLFLSGDMTSQQLCTSCTQNVLAAYVSFENDFPYVNGLPNSPILGGQVELWKDIGKTCGPGFLSSITAQSGNTVSAASHTVVYSSVISLAAALSAAFFLL